MTELSPRARAACEALRADGASDEERERVRARLSALGVAMSVGAGAALTAGTATSAAASVASVGIHAGAPSALPVASLATQAGGSALGGTFAAKGALVGAASAGKLLALPMAVKAGLAAVAVGSALVAPTLFTSPAPGASRATHEYAQHIETPATPAQKPRPVVEMMVEPAREQSPLAVAPTSAPVQTRTLNGAAPRRQNTAQARAIAQAPTAPPESTLAAESALLAQALAALRSGHAERARDLLQRHEEIYGVHALLARERERMRRELSHLLR